MDRPSKPTIFSTMSDYPADVQEKLLMLRQLILDVAAETSGVDGFQETIKWGQPSYVTTSGSTIRMDWSADTPNRYFLYFHCKTRLVETFRVLYEDQLQFEGNRAIALPRNRPIPTTPLKHCIALGLLYHKVKHQPLLGA